MQGYTIAYTPGEEDEPDTYAFHVVVSHERVRSVAVIDTYPDPEMTAGSRRIAGWVSGYASGGAWFDPAIARHFREQLDVGSAARLDLWPMWDAIESPALVVRGAESDVLPAELAAEMVARRHRPPPPRIREPGRQPDLRDRHHPAGGAEIGVDRFGERRYVEPVGAG